MRYKRNLKIKIGSKIAPMGSPRRPKGPLGTKGPLRPKGPSGPRAIRDARDSRNTRDTKAHEGTQRGAKRHNGHK